MHRKHSYSAYAMAVKVPIHNRWLINLLSWNTHDLPVFLNTVLLFIGLYVERASQLLRIWRYGALFSVVPWTAMDLFSNNSLFF